MLCGILGLACGLLGQTEGRPYQWQSLGLLGPFSVSKQGCGSQYGIIVVVGGEAARATL